MRTFALETLRPKPSYNAKVPLVGIMRCEEDLLMIKYTRNRLDKEHCVSNHFVTAIQSVRRMELVTDSQIRQSADDKEGKGSARRLPWTLAYC